MKSYIYIAVIAVSISAFSSCSENEIEKAPVSNVRVMKTIGVGIPSSNTRAYLTYNGTQSTYGIYWNETDKITLFAEGHEIGDTFDFVEYTGEFNNQAIFKGMTYEAQNYTILYPAQNSARLTDEGLVFTIPSVQKATPGSFDPAAGVQIGSATDEAESPTLKNTVAYLLFHAEPDVYSVEMKSNISDWYLSGTVIGNPKSGGGLITGFVDGKNNVKMNDIPAEGGDFLFAFIPSTSNPGFTISVSTKNGSYDIEFSSKNQFAAAQIYKLGTLGVSGWTK